MFPTVVMVQAEVDLDEGPPFGAFGFADEMHGGFLRRMVGLARVAGDAGADNIFPGRGAATIARDDVVEVQIFAIENLAAILAGVVIALENIMTCEFDFLLGQAVKNHEQNDAGNANSE